MLILGLPLLWLYLRLNLTSLRQFAVGGSICAMVMAAILAGTPDIATLVYYGAVGMIVGIVFRIILFGVKTDLLGR